MFLLVGHEKNVIYSKLVNNPFKWLVQIVNRLPLLERKFFGQYPNIIFRYDSFLATYENNTIEIFFANIIKITLLKIESWMIEIHYQDRS